MHIQTTLEHGFGAWCIISVYLTKTEQQSKLMSLYRFKWISDSTAVWHWHRTAEVCILSYVIQIDNVVCSLEGENGSHLSSHQMVTGQLADTPTRGLPTRGLDISRTGQLAVSQMLPKRKTKHAKSPMASASCPVRDLSSTRVV